MVGSDRDDRLRLLPHIGMQFVSRKEDGCAYFQQQLLLPLSGRVVYGNGDQQDALALWNAILNIRYKWMRRVTEFKAAGLGNAVDSTWNTRMNCRPVMVDVTPGSLACGFIRICPFCYARKCWREYNHLRDIMFCGTLEQQRQPDFDVRSVTHARRRVTGMTRRVHMYAHNPTEVEQLLRVKFAEARQTRDLSKNEDQLEKLSGWFRCSKVWVTKQTDGLFRITAETTLMGTSRGQTGIPLSLFLSPSKERPKRKRNIGGKVFEHTWYDPKLTPQDFRRWMLRVMRYRPEWLSNDIETEMAYNRAMMDMKYQQFYCGKEFRRREVNVADCSED